MERQTDNSRNARRDTVIKYLLDVAGVGHIVRGNTNNTRALLCDHTNIQMLELFVQNM